MRNVEYFIHSTQCLSIVELDKEEKLYCRVSLERHICFKVQQVLILLLESACASTTSKCGSRQIGAFREKWEDLRKMQYLN